MLKDIIFFYEFACFQLPLSGSQRRRLARGRQAPARFQLPLGITYRFPSTEPEFLLRTFNSLSRDHSPSRECPFSSARHLSLSTPSLGITGPDSSVGSRPTTDDFQLPLSGSRSRASIRRIRSWYFLSTPSLGITSPPVKVPSRAAKIYFQLPLSGSQRPRESREETRQADFQLPLSGSHEVVPCCLYVRIRKLSTPSLGITEAVAKYGANSEQARKAFNSLSRDHYLIVAWSFGASSL
jgi:hypothetical protein